MEFASTIRERRHSLGLTQQQLADLSGVSERLIRSIESGKRTIQLDGVLAVLWSLGLELQIARRQPDGNRD